MIVGLREDTDELTRLVRQFDIMTRVAVPDTDLFLAAGIGIMLQMDKIVTHLADDKYPSFPTRKLPDNVRRLPLHEDDDTP